ncbi:phytanoyl-CoA dioxygenase family protein [Paenibacillus albus]|nr:phytanoyl-CoA dioxygenase family protein [Paenibacillus albus]
MQLKSAYRQFREEGYIIYPEVFKGKELEQLLVACNSSLEQYTEAWDLEKPNTDFEVMRHLNNPRWHRDNQEYLTTIMEKIADPRCLGPVEQIFAGPSLFRCTSYFINHRFTSHDGGWHRDSQFMCSSDEEERRMLDQIRQSDFNDNAGIQFQIALIDNDDIEYVPYSANRHDSPEEAYIRLADNKSHNQEDGMPNAMRIPLKAGDAVIFNPYGLHRGRYHKDIPRRTLMLTYTRSTSVQFDYFSNQPWCAEPDYLNGLSPRATAYFQQFINAYHGFWESSK